jgi:hypothetical protein
MVFYFQKPYGPAIEQQVRQDDQSLSDKDRRRLAAVQAITRGHGGIQSIAQVLGGDPHTVQEGMRALKQRPDDPAGKRVRKPGGGRKKTEGKHAALMQQVHDTMKDRTAGDPMREDGVWTEVTPQEISDSLHAQAVSVGPRIVRRMLATLGVARRQRAKGLPGGDSPHRDAPCRHVSHLIQAFLEAGHPVLRIDTQKQEGLGTLYRDGKVSCHQALPVFDHDVPSLARGVIMPHGLSDLAQHHGWMPVGLRHDTTACACESFRVFWHSDGQRLDPNASAILLWCDGGGRNSGHKPLFTEDLQGVVNDLGVPIRVAHSPAYGAKCHPSARRLFSHVTRACQGIVFDSLHTVRGLIQKTKTHQGLAVTVRVVDTLDETGRKVSDAFKQHMPIVFDPVLPTWNYWAVPQCM